MTGLAGGRTPHARPQRTRASAILLFDLDETLVAEERVTVAAFAATAQFAASRHDLDHGALAVAARARARELWRAGPYHPYCLRVGISSWEGLWCRFRGDDPHIAALREWSPAYRRDAWSLALAEQGIHDPPLAEELGERFGAERRARHETFADVAAVLTELGATHTLALVTNGASCLQREKLAASGLAECFPVVVVSADLGVGKPDARVFGHALAQLDGDPRRAVMIGDSVSRDIRGALGAGLGAVWVNRSGDARADDHPDVPEIATLTDLPATLAAMA